MHREKRRVIHRHYVDIDALNALRCDLFCCTYVVNFTRLLFPRDFLCENVCLSRLGTWSSGSEYTLRPFQFRTSEHHYDQACSQQMSCSLTAIPLIN